MSSTSMLQAQSIPIRALGATFASSADSVQMPAIVRALSDGSVLVSEVRKNRVLFFEEKLSRVRTVEGFTPRQESLIAYPGDSTLAPDWESRSFVVLDPKGKVSRSMAMPNASLTYANFTINEVQNPVADAKGRLIYQGFFPPRPGPTEFGPVVSQRAAVPPDSSPLLRADFDTRRVDTVGILRRPARNPVKSVTRTNNGNVLLTLSFNPMPRAVDGWTVLSGGTVALVRGHDYHIDWADGTSTRSTAKMPLDWRRQTDEDKAKAQAEWQIRTNEMNARSVNENTDRPVRDGSPQVLSFFEMVPMTEFADFVTPFLAASIVPDRENRLWIPPRTSMNAGGGLLYDVINQDGIIVERVRIPQGRAIVSFVSKDVAVLTRSEKQHLVLELAWVNQAKN